jgi:hypothetical protein
MHRYLLLAYFDQDVDVRPEVFQAQVFNDRAN